MKPFTSPQRTLGQLDAVAVAALIAAAADMTLIADASGVILDVAFQSEDLARDLDQASSWIGRKWADIVVSDSRQTVASLIADASGAAATRWRHVIYPTNHGRDIPVLISAVSAGEQGHIVAFARDLRAMSDLQQRLVDAQQLMERDYSRLMNMETRYRILFQMSPEAVLILDGATSRVIEANPAARALLNDDDRRVVTRSFFDFFEPSSVPAVRALLAGVRMGGRTDDIRVQLDNAGREVSVAAHLFRQDNEQLLLIRLTPAQNVPGTAPLPNARAKLLKLIESAPDGFVVTSPDGRVIAANAGFLAMAQLASEEQARGESLERWLGRPGVDLNVLIANLRQHGTVRLFATTVRDEFGAATEVEISAVALMNGGEACFGFAIRNIGRRLGALASPSPAGGRALPRSVEQLTELIGRVSLKDLVREATDMIERLCIEAALEMTRDNRASAAEILGLSRQSLYVKLRRYGLGDLAADNGGV